MNGEPRAEASSSIMLWQEKARGEKIESQTRRQLDIWEDEGGSVKKSSAYRS
jgi:hypothetical protein